MSHAQQRPIVIVGGGITGLATAHALQESGCRNIILLESTARLGGTIRTHYEDGFVIEVGPDSFLTTKPHAMELVRSLGIASELISPVFHSFLVYNNRRLFRIPEGLVSLVPTSPFSFLTSNLLSMPGRLRVLMERFHARSSASKDESLQSFFTRRFGIEFTETLAEPLFAGIHAGRGDTLSMLALFPQFREMEQQHGSITRAVQARRHAQDSSAPALFMSLRNGMESLVQRLAHVLTDVSIRLNCGVTHLVEETNGHVLLHLVDGRTLEADHVVLTTPAHSTANILETILPDVAERLRVVPFVSSAAVTLAYPSDRISHALGATGFIVPRKSGFRMTACSVSTSKWVDRAPDGIVLFRCFFGCQGDQRDIDLDDHALGDLARNELETMIGVVGDPAREWIHRWPEAMPQYTVGHLERMTSIDALLEGSPGIHLAGSSYRGVGIPDCILQARQIAEGIAAK